MTKPTPSLHVGQLVTLNAEMLGSIEMRRMWRPYADQVAIITQIKKWRNGTRCEILFSDSVSGWFSDYDLEPVIT